MPLISQTTGFGSRYNPVQVLWDIAVTGMPTVVLLAIWEEKKDKKGTFVGSRHGALLSSILPGLCHSPGRCRREQQETAIPDKQGKGAYGH